MTSSERTFGGRVVRALASPRGTWLDDAMTHSGVREMVEVFDGRRRWGGLCLSALLVLMSSCDGSGDGERDGVDSLDAPSDDGGGEDREFDTPSCTDSSQCDDGLACTDNICDTDAGHCRFPVSEAGTVCRAPSSACDPAELCDGSSTDCPEDVPATAGAPCDDGDPCTMLDLCDDDLNCAGSAGCTASPVLGTGSDTRVAVCLTDADCDDPVPNPGCYDARPVDIKSSWSDWDERTSTPMAVCGSYWAYTSPPLDRGTEQCYAFYHSYSSTWFTAGQGPPAECGPDHCGRESCAFTP